jgi:uncharacterized delta-60 repeat protein
MKRTAALATLVLLLVAPAVAQARAGQVDTHFGRRGSQTLGARGGDAVGGAILSLGNGRVLAGGAAAGRLVVVRLHASTGKLDNGFGTRGQFAPQLPGSSLDGVQSLATFRDGRIVAAATIDTGGVTRLVAVKLLPNGDVDPSFGGGLGYVITGPAGSQLGGMAMDTNGNIVLAGSRGGGAGEVPLVMRLAPDGTPDGTFGAGGTVDGAPLGLAGRATAVLARPDGTVVFTVGATPGHSGSSAFTVVRLLANGAADPGFNGTGISTVAFGTPQVGDGLGAGALHIGPSGTLLVGGTVLSAGGSQQALVERLHANGTLDKRFGTRGFARIARAGRNLRVTSLSRDDVGRILIAGTARAPGSLVARLHPSGRRDTHFGTHGVTFPALGRPGRSTPIYTELRAVDAVGTHAIVAGLAAAPGPLVRSPTGTAYTGRFSLTVSRLR